jgi:predicted AlkP superfamily phosphohydrolase/phosphomutase
MTEKTVGSMKAFNWIKKHGTTMSQVVPVFPPYDLPTWTSLATGLYPKNTGVVGDYMFNLKSRELYSREDSDGSLDNWWTNGEPIWSTAAKHGR